MHRTQRLHPQARGLPGRPTSARPVRTAALRRWVARWEQAWDAPGLARALDIRFSTRLRRTWGRALPAQLRVTLAAGLLTQSRALLKHVLCHEAAHVAVHLRHGRRARPHGPEWAALVQQAGHSPVRRLPSEDAIPARASLRFEHRCPVCHSRRLARRRMPSWRCTACTEAGLPGALTISRLPSP